jgi:serine protease Do
VRLTVWRAGKSQDVTATVAAWPGSAGPVKTSEAATAAMMAARPDPGVKLAAITDADRKKYKLDPDLSGVLITYVAQNSEANTYGLTPGNVVMQVQGVPVTTPDEVWQAVTQAEEQHRSYIAVLVQTNSGPQWLSFSISATKS